MIRWVAESIGVTEPELRLSRMVGSTSSSVFLVHTGSKGFVLRILDNKDWLVNEPDLAEHEATALAEAFSAGICAPELVAYVGIDTGFDAPMVLMSYLPGAVELRPADFSVWIRRLALQLAEIHRHSAASFPWRFRTWLHRGNLRPPVWTSDPDLRDRAIEIARQPAPAYSPVFIHRDYHPTNILWENVEISGVVDWINACHGPPGIDVGHCRSNLASMYGTDAADEFLREYCEAAPSFEYNPYWDLEAALDTGDELTPYPPWADFGLGDISAEDLATRTDMYLRSIMTGL